MTSTFVYSTAQEREKCVGVGVAVVVAVVGRVQIDDESGRCDVDV